MRNYLSMKQKKKRVLKIGRLRSLEIIYFFKFVIKTINANKNKIEVEKFNICNINNLPCFCVYKFVSEKISLKN